VSQEVSAGNSHTEADAGAEAKGVADEDNVSEEEAASSSPEAQLLALQEILRSKLGEAIEESKIDRGMLTIVVTTASLLSVCERLRNDPALAFDYLACLTSIDRQDHFEVAYNLRSLTHKHEFCLKVRLPHDNPRLPSVTSIWRGANWHEREAFDLMGIIFDGHPDLRRILLPADWEGHPLRKDYVYTPEDVPAEPGPPPHLLQQIEGVE